MTTACHIKGRNVSFRLEDVSGACFGLSGHGSDATLDIEAELLESSGYGDTCQEQVADLTRYSVAFSGYWHGEGSDSTACKLVALIGASQGTVFELSPAGSYPAACATCPNYTACAHLKQLSIGFPADGMVTWSFNLEPRSGSLTITTGSWT